MNIRPPVDEWIVTEARHIASWAVHEAGVATDVASPETLIAELTEHIAHFGRSLVNNPPSAF